MKKSIITALLITSVSASLNALTLDEGVKEVLTTNPVVLERLHNYRATLEDLRTSESSYLPSLDYSASVAREHSDNSNTGYEYKRLTAYQHSLTLTQNIFNGHGTKYDIDNQKARILAAANYYIENANDAALNLVQMYIVSLKNRDLLRIAQANIKFNESISSKVAKLFQAGMVTKSEMEKADTSLALANSNYTVAENNLADSLYNLERVLGRHVSIDDLKDIQFDGIIPSSLEEMLEYAKVHNPSVLVRDYNIKSAMAKYKQSKSAYYPKIDAFARTSWSKDSGGTVGIDKADSIGLTLTYNLFKGGADEAQMQKNLSASYQERNIQEDTLRKLKEQGELSWSAKKHLTNQLKYLRYYRENAIKTLELYQKEYDLGRKTLLDLIVAQNDFSSSESQIARAEYDLLFANYRILDSMGSMVQTIIGSKATKENTNIVGLVPLDSSRVNDQKIGRLSKFFLNNNSDADKISYKRDVEK